METNDGSAPAGRVRHRPRAERPGAGIHQRNRGPFPGELPPAWGRGLEWRRGADTIVPLASAPRRGPFIGPARFAIRRVHRGAAIRIVLYLAILLSPQPDERRHRRLLRRIFLRKSK